MADEGTGQSQYIEVSMAEVMSSMIPEAFLEYTMNGRQLQGMGNHHPRWSPPTCIAASVTTSGRRSR